MLYNEDTVMVAFKVPRELKEKAQKQAERERRSLSNMIVIAIEEHLKSQEESDG